MSAQTVTAPPPSRRGEQTMSTRERWRRRGPLLPALIFTIFVTQIPFLLTIAISTLNWNVLQPGEKNFLGMGNYDSFAGLDNYGTVFTDARLRTAVVNTIVLTVSVVVISSLLGLVLAVLLDRKFPGRGLARTLLIAPFLVMPVASALLWKHAIYNPDYGLLNGSLNWVYHLFGAEGPTKDWVSGYPMPAVVVALVWQWTPFMMLILLAGLQSQPGDVLEAAKIDRRRRHPDLPVHHAAAPAPVHRALRPARLHLRPADLRRDLHDHPGRARVRDHQPAVRDLPDDVPQVRVRPGRRRRRRGRDRLDHRRDLRAPHHLVPVHGGGEPMSTTTDTSQNPFAPADEATGQARRTRRTRKAKDDASAAAGPAGRSWPGC